MPSTHTYQNYTLFGLLTWLLIASVFCSVQASEVEYSLTPEFDFSSAHVSATWVAPQLTSTQPNHYLIANTNGQLFQVINGNIQPTPVIELSTHLKPNLQIKLTALSLHPNFSNPDKNGEGVLYTAHIENIIGKTKSYISDSENSAKHERLAVVTEWKMSKAENTYSTNTPPREVIRISLPEQHLGITQLAFNPHLKLWNTDFALLHIVLPSMQKNKTPLYSGSILRIKPDRFGLKQYTVPSNNPFTKSPSILDEIILVGGDKIAQIGWTKDDDKKLIIAHNIKNNMQVSWGKVGSNWLKSSIKKVIWQAESANSDASFSVESLNTIDYLTLLYKGHEAWKIERISLSPSLNDDTIAWPLSKNNLNLESQLVLFDNRPSFPLLYNQSNRSFANLMVNVAGATPKATKKVTQEHKKVDYSFLILLAIFAVILIAMAIAGVIMYTKYKGESMKGLLRKHYSHFEYVAGNISLYKRKQTTPSHTIRAQDTQSATVFLNDTPILLLNKNSPFNDEVKAKLLQDFAFEQQIKMTKDKVRKVILILQDNHKKNHTICLYLRKGDQRYTKANYNTIIAKIIDWSQQYSQLIKS